MQEQARFYPKPESKLLMMLFQMISHIIFPHILKVLSFLIDITLHLL